jgi:amidohydrolase
MTDSKQAAQARYQEIEPRLVELARWLYENPEIAMEEHHSSQRLASMLEDCGFDVERPAYGLETAFVARAGSEGPELVICCEYDALPEVGHACGHNLIAAAAVGAGHALAGLADDLGFRVTVLGTPAEEKHGGKVDLIAAGAFEGAAAAMMVHPGTEDVVDPVVLAVTHFDIDFYGHEAHASGAPQQGINALDAAVQAYNNVSMLRQALYARDRVHGVITYGGGAPNVIPAHTSMSWYVRAETTGRLEVLYPKVLACFEAAAAATGCELNVREAGHRNIDLVSNQLLVDLYLENTAALGRPMERGKDQPIEETGSTDMGNVSHELPAIHPMLDIHTGGPKNHEKEFAAHTLSEDGTAAIRDGALGMAWTTIDLATRSLWDEL